MAVIIIGLLILRLSLLPSSLLPQPPDNVATDGGQLDVLEAFGSPWLDNAAKSLACAKAGQRNLRAETGRNLRWSISKLQLLPIPRRQQIAASTRTRSAPCDQPPRKIERVPPGSVHQIEAVIAASPNRNRAETSSGKPLSWATSVRAGETRCYSAPGGARDASERLQGLHHSAATTPNSWLPSA